mgnify:CR=1 FL=1
MTALRKSEWKFNGNKMIDETEALQAFFDGKPIKTRHRGLFRSMKGDLILLHGINMEVSRSISFSPKDTRLIIHNCMFKGINGLDYLFDFDAELQNAQISNCKLFNMRDFARRLPVFYRDALEAAE